MIVIPKADTRLPFQFDVWRVQVAVAGITIDKITYTFPPLADGRRQFQLAPPLRAFQGLCQCECFQRVTAVFIRGEQRPAADRRPRHVERGIDGAVLRDRQRRRIDAVRALFQIHVHVRRQAEAVERNRDRARIGGCRDAVVEQRERACHRGEFNLCVFIARIFQQDEDIAISYGWRNGQQHRAVVQIHGCPAL